MAYMEKAKTFEELVKEQGGTITPWEPTKEFLEEFEKFMKESIRQSNINHAKAIEEASKIIIF